MILWLRGPSVWAIQTQKAKNRSCGYTVAPEENITHISLHSSIGLLSQGQLWKWAQKLHSVAHSFPQSLLIFTDQSLLFSDWDRKKLEQKLGSKTDKDPHATEASTGFKGSVYLIADIWLSHQMLSSGSVVEGCRFTFTVYWLATFGQLDAARDPECTLNSNQQ